MTADQRLDQLEPLVAQNLAVADRHTAQLKQLVNLAIQQSENMQFALRELVDLKEEQRETKKEQQVMAQKLEVIDSKLDRIFDLMSGSGQ